MANDRSRLSESQLDRIYTRRIRPDALEAIPSSAQPAAVLVGGQPGAGKSFAIATIRKQLSVSIGPTLVLSGDDLREYHPYWRAHAHNDPDAAALTQADSGAWYARLTRDAIEHRANLVFETSMRQSAAVLALVEQLRVDGYKVGVTVIAAEKEQSRLATLARYDAARSAGDVPRFVPGAYHDNAYAQLRTTIGEIEKTTSIDNLIIIARDGKSIYTNRIENGAWTAPPRALDYLDSARERTPTARDLVQNALRWETLVQRLANDPVVNREVAAQALMWRNEAVARAENDPDAREQLAHAREAESFRTMPRHQFEREFPQLRRAAKLLDLAVSEAEKYSEQEGTRFISAARARISERIERGDFAPQRQKELGPEDPTR